MRKFIPILAVAAIVAVLGSVSAASFAASTAPHLSVLKRSPLTLQGSGFKPRSHIKVTFTASRQVTKRITVKRNGRFTVSFTVSSADRCTQWVVKVTQTGHAAVLMRGPRPMCAPEGGYGSY